MQTILQTKEKNRKKREEREKKQIRKKCANSERWRHHLHYCGHRLKHWRLVDNHARTPTDQLVNFSTIRGNLVSARTSMPYIPPGTVTPPTPQENNSTD